MSAARTRRPFAFFMAGLTVIYLAFELGFNARLLDVTGVNASHDQVESIEYWGRLISGVAAMLALWGLSILPRAMPSDGPRWPLPRLAIVLLLSGAATIASVFFVERMIVDVVVDRSSGEARRAAAHLRVVSVGVLQGNLSITGMDLTPAELAAPAGKAFLSMFPFAALVTPDLGRKTEALLRSAIRSSIEAAAGGLLGFYGSAFRKSVETLRDDYNAYVDGENRYNDVIAGIPRRQEDAWNRYVDDVRRRTRRDPANVPRPYWPQVRASVRGQGVPVPDDWQPSDRATFNTAVARSVLSEADAQFRAKTQEAAGAELPHGLQWGDFVAQSAVQSRWRHGLGASPNVMLSPNMGPSAVERDVYGPRVQKETDDRLATLLAPSASFADGGTREVEGRRAMEALVVPPIALAFSLMGALLHIFKATNYLAECTLPRLRFRSPVIGAAVAVVALSAFWLPNAVSSSAGFGIFERNMRAGWGVFGWPFATGILWTVQAQPHFYPLNEAVRNSVLFGLGFGYQPRKPTA